MQISRRPIAISHERARLNLNIEQFRYVEGSPPARHLRLSDHGVRGSRRAGGAARRARRTRRRQQAERLSRRIRGSQPRQRGGCAASGSSHGSRCTLAIVVSGSVRPLDPGTGSRRRASHHRIDGEQLGTHVANVACPGAISRRLLRAADRRAVHCPRRSPPRRVDNAARHNRRPRRTRAHNRRPADTPASPIPTSPARPRTG